MKKILILWLLLFFVLSVNAQDTLRHYVNNELKTTVKDSASLIREIIEYDNHYSMAYYSLEGIECNYCEFNSLENFMLDGLAKHYYEPGVVYATGNYSNDAMQGQWLYFDNKGDVDTVTYLHISHYGELLGTDFDKMKLTRISKAKEQRFKNSISLFINKEFHIPARIRAGCSQIKVPLKMVVDTDGKLKDVELVDVDNQDLRLEMFRVLSMFNSDFIPQKAFETNLLYHYEEEFIGDVIDNKLVDIKPEFPGGEFGLRRYIGQSVKYPRYAQERGIMGQVYVSFIIDINGFVRQVKIAKSVSPLLDEEAIRVVEAMPNWTPGFQNGKPVNVSYKVPVNFILM